MGGGNNVGRTNVGIKIWTSVAGGTNIVKGPQGQVFVLQVPYEHQGGVGARSIDTPKPGPVGPIPDPAGPADVSPPLLVKYCRH